MSYTRFVRNESVRLGLALVVLALVSGLVLLRQSQSGASHAAISERLAAAGRRPALAGSLPGLTSVAETDQNNQLRANEAYGELPLSFEVNQGQTDAQVKFLSRGSGSTLFLTATEAVFGTPIVDCRLRNEKIAGLENPKSAIDSSGGVENEVVGR